MEELNQIYTKLITQKFSEWELIDRAIKSIGILIDLSSDLAKEEGFTHAINESNQILASKITSSQKAILYYFIGNAWSGLRSLKHNEKNNIWKWEQNEIEQEIFNYRLSILLQDNPYSCQVHTNLGNIFNHFRRFVEAISYWNNALSQSPSFGMALANKGHGLISYTESLYDDGHRGLFIKHAYALLKEGLATGDIYPDAKKSFESRVQYLENRAGKSYLNELFDMNNFPLGESDAEKRYRKWCLGNTLFLNPLNDLGPYNIAARDILTCPSITSPIDEGGYLPPGVFAFYNQLKQEYAAARYLLYESIHSEGTHFSDKEVFQYNTLDYPCYGLNIEKAKIAFRICYSLFDKISYFLNEYLKLGIKEREVSFKTIWYERKKNQYVLREKFREFENWPLRGLFWIAKDLSENRPEFKNSIEPDSKDLVRIRNHLEHKYLTITEYDMSDLDGTDDAGRKIYRIQSDDFISKTIKVLKLAREALIYLSLGTHIEERKKTSKYDKPIMPMFLDSWEDDWKR